MQRSQVSTGTLITQSISSNVIYWGTHTETEVNGYKLTDTTVDGNVTTFTNTVATTPDEEKPTDPTGDESDDEESDDEESDNEESSTSSSDNKTSSHKASSHKVHSHKAVPPTGDGTFVLVIGLAGAILLSLVGVAFARRRMFL